MIKMHSSLLDDSKNSQNLKTRRKKLKTNWKQNVLELLAVEINDKRKLFVYLFQYRLSVVQWFSTSGGWRPTKRNNTLFGDPFITIILLKRRFLRPKSKCPGPKSGSLPTC